jgi:hypothetical protein
MTWTLELEDPDGTTTTIANDEILKQSPRVRHEQLAVSEWNVRVPYRESLESHRHAEAFLTFQNEVIMRGPVTTVSSADGESATTVRGKDFVDELRRSWGDRPNGLVYEVTQQEGWKAIQDLYAKSFFDSYTTNVVQPSPATVDTNKSIQSADTTSEFSSVWSPAATDPFTATNDGLELTQTGFFKEAENASGTTAGEVSDGDYSNGAGESLSDLNDNLSFSFTLDHTIPAADVGFAVRLDTLDGDHPPFDLTVDGEVVQGVTAGAIGSGLDWFGDGSRGISSDLSPGSHTAELDCTGTGGGPMDVDCLNVFDGRYSYNFDNSVNANGYLAGPEPFPDAAELAATEARSEWNITEATVTITANDTTGNQRLQVNLSGAYKPTDGTENNTESITVTNAGASSTATTRLRLSRFGSQSGSSPTQGVNPQRITSYDLQVDTNDLAVIEDETYKGSFFNVWQDLHRDSNMTAVAEYTDTSRELTSLEPGDQTNSQSWTRLDYTREYDIGRYGNRIQAIGGESGGSRATASVTDDGEVSRVGEIIEGEPVVRTSVTDENVLLAAARNRLAGLIEQDRLAGEIVVVPTSVPPGYAYTVEPFDNTDVALLSVQITGNRATLQFREAETIATAIADVRETAQNNS